jgi:hypothetical protein
VRRRDDALMLTIPRERSRIDSETAPDRSLRSRAKAKNLINALRVTIGNGAFVMSHVSDDPNFRLTLARAVTRAWDQYSQGDHPGVDLEYAHKALAACIVALAKGGVLDEDWLAEGGLMHLRLLTSSDGEAK